MTVCCGQLLNNARTFKAMVYSLLGRGVPSSLTLLGELTCVCVCVSIMYVDLAVLKVM